MNPPEKEQQEQALDEIFGPGGILERDHPRYEFRPSQLQMSRAVLKAIYGRYHACIEAGTGTGKTLAYLIPSLMSRRRVVISTATKNLQEQLFLKDLPFIQEKLFPSLKATCLKGRQNYLCLKKLSERTSQDSLFQSSTEEKLQQIASWSRETETGDRSEIDWLADDDPLWPPLDARSDTCLGQDCAFFDDCFVTRARRKAFESDVLVVNHALLFANLALQTDEIGSIFPDFSILILDEAHEAEDVAADYFGRQISNYQIDELCRDAMRTAAADPSIARSLEKIQQHAKRFFDYWPVGEGRFSINFHGSSHEGRTDLREDAMGLYEKLCAALSTLSHQLAKASSRLAEADALLRRLDGILAALDEVFQMEDPEHVYWFERRGRGVFLHRTPIEVSPLLRECLFEATDTVVLISATLTASGRFDYVRKRLGVDQAEELVLSGEFDYRNQAVLYVPSRMPEPRSPQFFLRALKQIRSILEITDGHAFLLFTSFFQMEKVYRALDRTGDYPLFRQGEMPRNRLLEKFRETPRAVLCATASFWQGVDVQGNALRAVIIDKLPFRVPTEPVVAARLHRIDREGGDSFLEYSVPEAVITLRQGLGRLIRSREDHGILAVLDGRLRTRRYGKLFLDSLPNCRLTDNIVELKNFYTQNVSIVTSGE